jgi:hypothetical protein
MDETALGWLDGMSPEQYDRRSLSKLKAGFFRVPGVHRPAGTIDGASSLLAADTEQGAYPRKVALVHARLIDVECLAVATASSVLRRTNSPTRSAHRVFSGFHGTHLAAYPLPD